MTRRIDFDDQLRAWADLGDERLPVQYLNAALAQIDTSPQRRARPGWLEFPHMNRYAPYALAAALIVVALISISLFVRPPDVGPTPLPQPSNEASQEPDATPQADATASPEEAPLGGGLILVYQAHEPPGPCHDFLAAGPFDVFTLDAGTGEQTLLGTAAEDCSARHLQLQWAPDREHVLMTDEFGQETMTLDTTTAAGRDLTFICCDLPRRLGAGRRGAFRWMGALTGGRPSRRDRTRPRRGVGDGDRRRQH